MRLSPLKRVSLGVGAVSFGAVALLMLYTVGRAWVQAGGSYTDILLLASFIGVLVWGLLWLVAGAFDRELHRAAVMSREAAIADESLRGPFGLGRVTAAWRQTNEDLRKRLDEAVAARRDLEVVHAAAESRRAHLETVLRSLDDAVLVTDGFNELVLANQAAADLLGFTLGTAARKPVDQLLRDPAMVRLIRDAREAGRVSPRLRRQAQHRITSRDRASIFGITLSAIHAPVEGGNGETKPMCTGVVTVLRDVTQQVEAAAHRGDFVASVSHELRTPLASIKGCLEMLIDGEAADAASRSEFYNIIQAETNRLSRLVDNILNISRIESGLSQPRRDRVALSAVVEEAVTSLVAQARAKRIALAWSAPSGDATVEGDRDMLLQAVHHLVGNAIKYTQDGGRIDVVLRRDEPADSVSVTVSDTGIGIPADALPHIFDKFYRVADHTRIAKGAGLGLNLVKHVVESVHGGTVRVVSTAGRGSAFTFTLPIAENHGGTVPVPVGAGDRAGGLARGGGGASA